MALVFYHGERGWTYSTEFADLLPKETSDWSFIPHLTYLLVDQSGIRPDEVKGEIRGQIAQLLMFAAYHEPVREVLSMIARLLERLPQTGGINYVRVFIRYIIATQESETVSDFVQMLQAQTSDTGEKIVTYAQELLQEGFVKGKIEGKIEGEIKGKIKGKIEVIESLLRIGVGWPIIVQAVGIDEEKFAKLKKQLASLSRSKFGVFGDFQSRLQGFWSHLFRFRLQKTTYFISENRPNLTQKLDIDRQICIYVNCLARILSQNLKFGSTESTNRRI
ncbi:Rpn family recombination-promoting nuclease/putative transposase [Chloroflexi bacterium TSY]|nr:Rpn family recombination-promoting nuclease/putative transposase [Chloroflexi bacterium TSY]